MQLTTKLFVPLVNVMVCCVFGKNEWWTGSIKKNIFRCILLNVSFNMSLSQET